MEQSDQTNCEAGRQTTRRRFLVGAGTAALVGTVPGTASAEGDGDSTPEAPDDYPLISTRDHFRVSWYGGVNLVDSETEQSYQKDGDWAGYDEGEDAVTVFVHGWNLNEDQGRNAAFTCDQALSDNDFDSFAISYNWDADEGRDIGRGWKAAKQIASRNGPKFANWITDFAENDGRTLRIIAHSLGARVVASALATLDEWNSTDSVEAVALLGGAIDDESVETDEEYGGPIENTTGQFDNYHKVDDDVLAWAYSSAEFDSAVGQYGIEDEDDAPDNYSDHDVTDSVRNHRSYFVPGEGCIPQVVEQF